MKKRKIISIMAASALIFGGLTLSVVSCGDTEQTVTNPKLELSLESSSIYVGETTKVSVKSEGKEVTDCEFVLEGDGNKYVSVDDDGTVTGIAPGKATIKARKANYQAGTIEITVVAVPVVEPDAVLEFEKGSFYNPNGSWSSGGTVVESPVESSQGSSGGQSIGYQSQGVSTTIEFTATSAGTVDLGFVMASTAMDFMNNMMMSPMTVKDVITIKVNDTPLTLDGYKLPGSDQPMNFTNWSEFKVNDVSVKQGANTIIVTTIASQGPNMDCIKVYGDLGIKQTEAKQPEKVSLGTYTYFVNGYEWGPGVYKIVADLGEGKNVKASDLSNDLFSVTAKGNNNNGGSRTVTDIYLVDENNEKDESLTEGSKIGFDLELNVTSQEWWGYINTNYNGCNPFYYDMTTSKNTWATDYTYEIRLNSNKTITIGDTTYNGKEAILTINTPSSEVREIPCLENWGEQKSYTLNDQTLTYKAFETTALKEDSGKNPLIIWLHGAGEGGTDVDIALLGNDVTNLGEEKIQSYFKTDTLEGAYVLAVQTPTFWMDNGKGGQGDGMNDSIYTEVLMKTIEKYVADNGDIDESRIYLGGCSNGGYMTMNMAIKHNDYFAAYYPVCEAKPDSSITDENIALLKESSIWFTAAANDTTVDPAKYTNATYARLMKAGASDVHYSLFEKVVGDDTGKEVPYMGHYSWIYTLKDECALDQADPTNIQAPSTEKVTYGGNEVNLWRWIAKHSKQIL